MNKTLYIKDEDSAIWDRARELAGEKLSPVIVGALKKFVAQKEAEQKGFDRIEINYNDARDHYLPKIKAFHGRWIIPFDKPLVRQYPDDPDVERRYAVAITAKGRWAIYVKTTKEDEEHPATWFVEEKFMVFDSSSAAAADPDPDAGNAIREAVRRMGVPVEELDI